jgi:pimeloyl-ACP methyl ester carboxylesterase
MESHLNLVNMVAQEQLGRARFKPLIIRALSRYLRTRPGAVFLAITLACGFAVASAEPLPGYKTTPTSVVECVVLLHGLGRTHRSMTSMADALHAAGYVSVNIDYPSRDQPIEVLADSVMREGVDRCGKENAAVIHFVTHSMGGILVRYFLANQHLDRIGRVVMLSPPNQGSEAVDMLKDEPLYAWINGPAGQQLGTGGDSLPLRLGPVDFPLGIITGNKAAFYDTWLADAIPGPNDGKVSVERARVAGMADFLVVPFTHTFIMDEPEVKSQTLHFLRHGRFYRANGNRYPAARP